jgi:hypothetical protein
LFASPQELFMNRANARVLGWAGLAICIAIGRPAHSQELLKAIEPGTGYSRMKQWAIEHELVFENFTKDSLVIKGEFHESGDAIVYGVRILSRFCAGDDYAGRAYNSTLQQFARVETKTIESMFEKHRQYVEALAGKPPDDGRFSGDYKLRKERTTDQRGIAVGSSSAQRSWDLGVFLRDPYLTIQVMRSKDELCK